MKLAELLDIDWRCLFAHMSRGLERHWSLKAERSEVLPILKRRLMA